MNQKEIFTKEELLAIRFYMGDPEVAASGLFKGGPKAYNTINALMHPGSANEKDKAREGRVIMLEDAEHLKSYLELIVDIYRAMEKYRQFQLEQMSNRQSADIKQKLKPTYRMDRLASLQRFVEDGYQVAGFFSTCKWGFLPEYAHGKANIVMLEVERDESVPFLDFEDIFEECYAKPEEAEILLPFGMIIQQMEQLPITEQEAEIFTDINGQPPEGKWLLHMTMNQVPELSEEELQKLYQAVTNEETVQQIIMCMQKLTAKQTLTALEEKIYNTWKMQLQLCCRTHWRYAFPDVIKMIKTEGEDKS